MKNSAANFANWIIIYFSPTCAGAIPPAKVGPFAERQITIYRVFSFHTGEKKVAEQNCYFIIKMVRRPDVPSAPFGSGPEKVIRSPTVTRHRVDIKTSDGLSGPGFIEIADSLAHDGGGEYKLVIKDLTECYKDVLPQDIAKAVQMDHDLQKWLGDAKVWHVGLARTNVQKPNRELC